MANRFERWMEHNVEGYTMETDILRKDESGWLYMPEEVEQNPDLKTRTPFEVDDDHLKEWIEFLRHCGGFEVWEESE